MYTILTRAWIRILLATLFMLFCLVSYASAQEKGIILLAQQGSLLAVDLANPLKAHPLFVTRDTTDRNPAFSPRTRTLAFDRSALGDKRRVYIATATDGLRKLGEGQQPAFSPGGTRLVVAGARGLYVTDVRTGSLTRQLTDDPSDQNPDWGPHGIVFDRQDGTKRAAFAIKPDGSGLERIIPLDLALVNPTWRPGSETLLASVDAENKSKCATARTLHGFAAINEYSVFIFASVLCNPSGTWSPNGQRILVPLGRGIAIVKPGRTTPEQEICEGGDTEGVDWVASDRGQWLLTSPARPFGNCQHPTPGPTLIWYTVKGKWHHKTIP